MNRNFSARSESSLTDIDTPEIKTTWDGGSRFNWRYVADLAEKKPDIVNETTRRASSTVQSPNVEAEHLIDTIDIASRIVQSPVTEHFRVLQEWEGIVLDVGDEAFVARLTDMTCNNSPEEEADFSIDEVRQDDRKLLMPGAVFRWIIGYEIKKDGTLRRASQIVFRRLPQWTKEEIAEADKEANTLLQTIKWK